MRRIVTAISAAALALSLVAQATPAQAATGYDSAYAGESAFLSLTQGSTGSFTVFFANTGTTTWTKGGSTQVDLAACKDDKVTCNAQDATEATFNSGWLSATRYASTTQTSVAPGQIGTFTYSVMVPASQAAGTYRFNGAVVVSSSGADVHNEGYYQDVTVPAATGAATLTSLAPDSGDDTGGTNVVITGTGFTCTTNPTVDFGTAAATVLSCGATSLTVSTPAHAIPTADSKEAVNVTVTNAGGTASNALTYTYNLSGSPTATAMTANGDALTLTFSQPVCFDQMKDDPTAATAQFTGTKNGGTLALSTDSADYAFPICGTDTPDTSVTITLTSPLLGGDQVTLTITTSGADSVENAAGTSMPRAQTLSATATADTTPPTIASAKWTSSTQVRVKWSETIGSCVGTATAFKITGPSSYNQTSTSVTCAGTDKYTYANVGTAATKAGTYTVAYTKPSSDGVKDLSGNKAASQSKTFTVTAPIITDTFTSATDFTATTGDVITVHFDQDMLRTSPNDGTRQLLVSDSDGTKAVIVCNFGTTDNASQIDTMCVWTAADTVEITIQESPVSADLLADGDFIGLQWPLTIDDITGFENVLGVDADVANSTDVTIEKQ